jgi:hypothetical protein
MPLQLDLGDGKDTLQFADAIDLLRAVAAVPSMRLRVGLRGGTIPLHGARVAEVLRTLPPLNDCRFTSDIHGDPRLLLGWRTPMHTGHLLLRAIGKIELGPRALEALTLCSDIAKSKSPGAKVWRVSALPDGNWNAVHEIFGPKKYANHDATDAAKMIECHGWRNYTDCDLLV